ncbi:unnamed protein product [Citrullus colocynthis]|uniref:Uncharacterized protein n=1 Tax=Citrullus colocynthis TaxID=252529 RepID=A0ABP0Y080_9ROSI
MANGCFARSGVEDDDPRPETAGADAEGHHWRQPATGAGGRMTAEDRVSLRGLLVQGGRAAVCEGFSN